MIPRVYLARMYDPSTLFAFALFVVFVLAFLASREFPAEGRVFPSAVGIVGALVAAAILIRRFFGWEQEESERGMTMDLPGDLHIGAALAYKRALQYTGWLVAYLLLIALMGTATATGIFMLCYLLFEARAPLWKACLLAILLTCALPVYLANLIGLSIPRGMLNDPVRQFIGNLL